MTSNLMSVLAATIHGPDNRDEVLTHQADLRAYTLQGQNGDTPNRQPERAPSRTSTQHFPRPRRAAPRIADLAHWRGLVDLVGL